MTSPSRPVILCILDGFGCSAEAEHNAIKQAKMPNWDGLLTQFPHATLNASEEYVGLPHGQMGNSEVGHMNIGAGRVMTQELPRIDQAIAEDSLKDSPALRALIETQKESGRPVHLLGLLSDGGVHSHETHLHALARILSGAGVPVRLHAFLDGRDTPPKSAGTYLARWEAAFAGDPHVVVATISGRYFAMDRDKRWDRVKLAYSAIAHGEAAGFPTPQAALEDAYAQGATDEFVTPRVIGDSHHGILPGDALLMANFRADRARELLHALLDPAFEAFDRPHPPEVAMAVGMVEYSAELRPLIAAISPQTQPKNTLGEVVAAHGMKQLRIAETEKYPHVTFFLNGGREEPFPGEERIVVPSPSVATYDLKPEMSAYDITGRLVSAIRTGGIDLIVVNYANSDMVGHSGDLNATVKAVEAVDLCLGQVWDAVKSAGGALLITADHGNAEKMEDAATHQPHTAHTTNRVPVLLAAEGAAQWQLNEGNLADIAPTVLQLLGLEAPEEMTGHSLLSKA